MATIRRDYVQTSLGQVLVRSGGRGRPVFVLHHTYGSSESALRGGFLERLADRFRVLAPDTLGNGDSDSPPQPLEVADYAANLAQVMERLGVERASFIGHHTGASIALELAVADPSRVSALILSGLPLWTAEERVNAAKRFTLWSMTSDPSYLRELWQRRLAITRGLTPEQMHWQYVEYLKAGPRVVEPLQALTRYDAVSQLPLVKCPTLALTALSDPLGKKLDQILAALPGSEQAIVTDGTLLHELDADAFLTTVSNWLAVNADR